MRDEQKQKAQSHWGNIGRRRTSARGKWGEVKGTNRRRADDEGGDSS